MAEEANDTGDDHNANQDDPNINDEGKEDSASKALLAEVKKLRAEFREAKEQNAYLKGLVEANVNRQKPENTTADDEVIDKLDPDAKSAVVKLIEREFKTKSQNIVGAVDMLISRADVSDFKEASGKNYKKYADRVDAEYQSLFRAGKPMTRAMIYKHLRAEDIDSGKVKIEDHSENDIQEREQVDQSVHNSLNMGGTPRGGKLSSKEKTQKLPSQMNYKEREAALKKWETELAEKTF